MKKIVSLQEIQQLHLANIYKARKMYDKAISVLQGLIELNSGFAAGYNNLGTVYDAEKKWPEAISAYQAAIDLQPDYADAYYNLGLAQNKAGRIHEAFNTYQALLELVPEHMGARFQLGRLYMQQNKFQEAILQFGKIEENYPFHLETQSNLATSFLRLGWLNQAKTHYQKALNIMPNDIQVLFNLGVIATQQGKISEAIEYYQRVLLVDPNRYEVHNNLGVAFLSVNAREKALNHFCEALRMQPDNKALHHTVSILSGNKNFPASPPEYIRSLFNSYADHYDAHLTDVLHYDVPSQLLHAVNKANHSFRDILDLGCGTGLCGEVFQDGQRVLTGVDLSEKMLAVASQKKLYQTLIEADITDFLNDKHEAYDLILAGDVLVYFGELRELFRLVHQALRRGGLFAFNAEVCAEENYNLTKSGRFAHGKAYLDGLIQVTPFRMLDYQVIPLRSQQGVSVSGHLYLLEKA